MLASGLLSNIREEVEIPLAIDAALAALTGAAAKLLTNESTKAHEAGVGATQRRVGSGVGA